MSEKTLKFDNVRLDNQSKQPIKLDLVNVDQMVISDKFKHSDDGFKCFISYIEGEIVKPLCIILPQMSGYIKYFENGGKNMSFMIKNDDVLDKYNEIWIKVKNTLNIKFFSMSFYNEKYIKAKVREFNGVIITNFLGNEVPKENVHYTCIACITIDSVMRMEKRIIHKFIQKNTNKKIKKIKMTKFRNIKLESDSESELESDTELESKFESDSDSDSEQL